MTRPSPTSSPDTVSSSPETGAVELRGPRDDRPIRRDIERGATIVASILLALLLGAAWEWFMERGDEAEYVERLQEEFEQGALELASDQAAREHMLAGSSRLLEAARVGLPASDDSLRALTAALIDFRYFTPTHPALDELIASGRLEFIRSVDVRRALLEYIQERDRLEVVEARERDFVAQAMEPWLVDHLPLTSSPTPGDPSFWGPGVVRADLERVLDDPALRTLLTLRLDRTETALRFSIGLGFRIEAVLEALGG